MQPQLIEVPSAAELPAHLRLRPAPRPLLLRGVEIDDAPAVSDDYEAANARKAQFAHTYNRGDPRAYFAALGPLDYDLPARVAPAFSALAAALGRSRRQAVIDVLDVGCSYGINSALLNTGSRCRPSMRTTRLRPSPACRCRRCSASTARGSSSGRRRRGCG